MGIKTKHEDEQTFLSAPKVASRYGVVGITLDRWERDENLAFPKPIYIGRNRFWKISELEVWERSLPRHKDRSRQAGVAA